MSAETALNNHLIVKHILSYANVADLKNFRLVSKLWHEESFELWRKSATLILNDPNEDRNTSLLTLEEFLKRVKKPNSDVYKLAAKPFQKYNVHEWDINTEDSSQNRFWKKFGSKTTLLKIDNCFVNDFHLLENVLPEKFPMLETLIMNNPAVTFYPDERAWNYPDEHVENRRQNFLFSVKTLEIPSMYPSFCDYWPRVMYNFPNVEHVTIRDNFCRAKAHNPKTHNELYMFVDGLRQNSQLPEYTYKIQTLDIMDFFLYTAAHWGGKCRNRRSNFQMPSLPLKTLTLDWGYQSNIGFVNQTLQKYSETLEVLKAFRAPINNKPFDLPCFLPGEFDCLKELYLWGNITCSLEFLRYTPNLKKLVMKQSCYDLKHKFYKEHPKYKKNLESFKGDLVSKTKYKLLKLSGEGLMANQLEELETDYAFTSKTMPGLISWMPNLKVVRMILTNDIITVICDKLPKLLELEGLFGSNVDDVGVTALLKCADLKRFKMNAFCKQAKLTMHSCINVFLKMKALRYLEIFVSEKPNEDIVAALNDRLFSVKIFPNFGKHDFECCKRKEFDQTYLKSAGSKGEKSKKKKK